METHAHNHHAMPTEGRALTGVAISATLHCLTGCALGEIAGMAIGTALGLSNLATVALAVALAFVFGYGLTSVPLLRAGLALSTVVPIALASDTLSIAVMEVVDNAIVVTVPGAMDAGLGSLLFWGSLAFALAIAGVVAVPVNRWLIARGKGHAAVHATGIHGGPPVPSPSRRSCSAPRCSSPRQSADGRPSINRLAPCPRSSRSSQSPSPDRPARSASA